MQFGIASCGAAIAVMGCSEADAVVCIRDGRRDIKRRREQNDAFNAVAAKVVAAAGAVIGCCGGGGGGWGGVD